MKVISFELFCNSDAYDFLDPPIIFYSFQARYPTGITD